MKTVAAVVVFACALLACSPTNPTQSCSPTTCQGCCTTDGQCVSGSAPSACGRNGTFCQTCPGLCSLAGRCEDAPVAGGSAGGSSTAGGRAGGSTAGGQAGGVTAGGTAGGAVAGGNAAGGNIAGGQAGGSVAGGNTAGGTVAPPLGDSCSAPIDLSFVGGVATAQATRAGSIHDGSGTCAGVGTGDIVFRFTTTSVGTVTIDLRPSVSTQRLSAWLRTNCASSASELPASCIAPVSAGSTAQIVQRSLAAGTYFLWVDGEADVGGLTATVRFSADVGDTCTSAIPLVMTNNEATVVGSTAGALADTTGTCGGLGADVVYRLDVTQTMNLEATLMPRNVNVTPVLYLRSSTCSGELGCAASTAPGSHVPFRQSGLTPGTYFLIVDSTTANAGEYVLNVRLVPPVIGDSCAAPKPLAFSNGTLGGMATETGDTTGTANDIAGFCFSGTGGDVIYSFSTTTILNLRATVTTTSSTYRPAVHVRSSSCSGVERACVVASLPGSSAIATVSSLPAGSYLLIVDGLSTQGPYTLEATLTTPTPGDSCTSPSPLTLPSDGGVLVVSDDTSLLFNDVTSSCATGLAPDAIYSFTTTQLVDFRADVASTPGYQPVVSLRSTSCTGSERACHAATTQGGTASVVSGALPVGSYFLVVDGVSGTAGPFTLSVQAPPTPPGDSCSLPKQLSFGLDGGTVVESGNTASLFNDASGSCISGTSGDAVYMFSTLTTLDLRATVTTTSPGFRPALYLRSSACTGSERSCSAAVASGGSTTLNAGGLPAGSYFLFVDGAVNTSGAFTLTANLSPPAPGDGCTSPAPLSFGPSGGAVQLAGDTSLMLNDANGTCHSGTSSDAVYAFSIATPMTLRARVTPMTPSYQPVLYLRSAICTTSSDRACAAATAAGTSASLAVGSLTPGAYYVFVDGQAGTAGAYSLDLAVELPLEGDSCSQPKPLLFSGTDGGIAMDIGDTTPLFHESTGFCATTGAGPDQVYVFTTPSVLDFRAAVTTTSPTYQPVVYLRASCTTSERTCVAATAAGGSASISSPLLPAGTHYLWVDGASSTSGPFALTASLGVPLAGDTCTTVAPLTFTNGAALVTADTTLAVHDQLPNCAAQVANDLVYSFTTATTLDFTARASTTSSTYRPVLTLRTASCSGTERACVAAPVSGSADLAIAALPAGTYFLWVDGAVGTAGPFTLSATLGAAPPDEVRGLPISAVAAPGPMTVGYDVRDRFNNVVTTDNATSFTVNATGGAIFSSASVGTIVSGAGTSSVVVRAASGQIRLSVTSSTSQTVTFSTVDSQPNGLRYTGALFQFTAPAQAPGCDTPTSTVFQFPTTAVPTGAGTVTVSGRGDFDGSTENLEVFMETAAQTQLGTVFVAGVAQCGASNSVESVPVSLSTLQSALADGTATVTLRNTSDVTCATCTSTEAIVQLTFPTSNTGTFQ